jgi:hypothetical protein
MRPADVGLLLSDRDALAAEVEELKVEVEELRKYLKVSREAEDGLQEENDDLKAFIRERDPRNASALYDRMAEDFYLETGLMAPGKSVPAEMMYSGEQEIRRQQAWRPFVNRWHEAEFDAILGRKEEKP